MKLKVKTMYGKQYEIVVENNAKVIDIKQEVYKHSTISPEDQKLMRSFRQLNDEDSIANYSLKDGDSLVLFKVRTPSPLIVEETTPAPTKQMIMEATGAKALPPRVRRTPVNSVAQLRTQLDDLVNTIIGFPSRATPATPTSNEPVSSDAAPSGPIEVKVDDVSLQTLKDMGFPENRAKKALILNRMNAQVAMEWLLEHDEDSDIDEPIPESQLRALSKEQSTFVPNPDAVKKLKDMGFADEDINTALRVTNNNSEAACSWLLGDRDVDPTPASFSLQDSGMIRAVLMNPTVQAGLSNPRVLAALKTLIENPSAAQQFANDPEIGPVLLQVHSIIHNQ